MKVIIFAGGGGTRFWPISREEVPKQFVTIKKDISTLQLSIQRVQPVYGWHNMYISTNKKYVNKVRKQVPQISTSNIFTEPARRDVGPAVGLALMRLKKMGVREPVFISWADHLIKNVFQFQTLLKSAEKSVLNNEYKALLWSEKPTFANSNCGWTHFKQSKKNVKEFLGHVYKPSLKNANIFFKSKDRYVYTGYIISTVDYLLGIYEQFAPKLYKDLVKVKSSLDTVNESKTINTIYPNIQKKTFDEIVLYNLPKKDVGVITSNMGWEDPGTLFALKKSLEPSKRNFVKGKGLLHNSVDSLIYNSEKSKMVVGSNLKETVIVNTKDVIYVTNKEGIGQIKELFKKLKKHKKYRKYL